MVPVMCSGGVDAHVDVDANCFKHQTGTIACAPGHIAHNAAPAAIQTSHQDVYPLVVVAKLDSRWGNN